MRPALEVADIFRGQGSAWRRANAGHISLSQLKAMAAIESCRTAALGGHVERCEDCARTRIAYIAGASRIAEIVARHRIPAISPFRAFPDRGGLMSYGPVLPQWEIRLGHLVASILKGAKPATLPLEQPINFELVVNAKAAGASGIAIPE